MSFVTNSNYTNIPNDNNQSNYRYAQYGNTLIKPSELALLRGSGQFNEPPNYIQTTPRGRIQEGSLLQYQNEPNGVFEITNKWKQEYKPENWNDKTYQQIIGPSDQNHVVGSSNFYQQDVNKWSEPDFGHSRGSDRFQVFAVQSLQLTPSILMNLFFSEENVMYIQQTIVEQVYKIRGIKIAQQSLDELLIIMRNKYVYAISGWLKGNIDNPSQAMARGDIVNPNGNIFYNKGPTSLHYQLKLLNQSVLEETVKQVLSGLDMYKQYYKDASSLPLPMDLPVLTTQKGSRELSENIAFQSGHQLTNAASSYNQRFNII